MRWPALRPAACGRRARGRRTEAPVRAAQRAERRLGRRLFQAALDWLERDGPRTLWIGVWSENLGAQRFYARHGFEKVGEYEFIVGSSATTNSSCAATRALHDATHRGRMPTRRVVLLHGLWMPRHRDAAGSRRGCARPASRPRSSATTASPAARTTRCRAWSSACATAAPAHMRRAQPRRPDRAAGAVRRPASCRCRAWSAWARRWRQRRGLAACCAGRWRR